MKRNKCTTISLSFQSAFTCLKPKLEHQYQKNMENLIKVNNKDIRKTLMTLRLVGYCIVNLNIFDALLFPLITLNK